MSTESQTVLVTGALGQVGKLLVELLVQRGRAVVGLDLRSAAAESAAARLTATAGDGTFRMVYVDITDAEAVRRHVGEITPDAIVHLAAIVSPPCYRNPDVARRVNVDGTRNLLDAAASLARSPLFIEASSAGVYGSRNPYRDLGRITPQTPANPVDCYGEDKIAAESLVASSGLRHATLRLGGVVSPDPPSGPDYLLLMRAIPRDTRVHMVDARDVALAFANSLDRIERVEGKTLLIAGNESYVHTHTSVQDDMFDAIGLGRIGPSTNLPGDPDDDNGWSFTDWFDTTESQQLLDYQQHNWGDTVDWVRRAHRGRRLVIRAVSPLVRPAIRAALAVQRRREHRGRYADPWTLIATTYGKSVLAPTSFGSDESPSRAL